MFLLFQTKQNSHSRRGQAETRCKRTKGRSCLPVGQTEPLCEIKLFYAVIILQLRAGSAKKNNSDPLADCEYYIANYFCKLRTFRNLQVTPREWINILHFISSCLTLLTVQLEITNSCKLNWLIQSFTWWLNLMFCSTEKSLSTSLLLPLIDLSLIIIIKSFHEDELSQKVGSPQYWFLSDH